MLGSFVARLHRWRMAKQTSDTAPRWASPYVTRAQLVATGLASRATLAREHARGALVPVGRRGGRGPHVYRTADVDRWLAGEVPAAAATAPARVTPLERARPSGDTAAALARIERTARGPTLGTLGPPTDANRDPRGVP